MSISCISVHREAFNLIVFVQLLSVAIWCCSLLIMIISKSLSCIVHLCNNIFSMRYSRHTPTHPPFHTHTQALCTFPTVETLLIESILLKYLKFFGEYYNNKRQKERKLNTSLISIIISMWLNFAACKRAKKSQYLPHRTIRLSEGKI